MFGEIKINTKKNHQVYKCTLINGKVHKLRYLNFYSVPNITGFLIIYFMKILQYSSNCLPEIKFELNYERVIRVDG
jgi:hypothetical protein